jgi:hypothetical protein
MAGDPKECRSQAQQCSEMAKRAASRKEKLTFLRLQRSWNKLAVEIEDAQAYLATSKATELGDAMDAESLASPRRDALDPPPSQ